MARGGKNRGGGGKWRSGQRGGRGGGRGGSANSFPPRDNRWGAPRSQIVRENATLEEYYNTIGVVPAEEREAFWKALKEDLPNSFRFAGSKGHALTVQRRLVEHYIPEIVKVEYEGKLVSPPKPVDWFPDQLAWTMDTPKSVIRRFSPFASFQKFLVSESSVGNITRQEVVSMIPPLVLDVRPGMTVLDLCAAPGSKSTQLIEMVHGGEEARVRKVLERVAKEQGTSLGPEGSEVGIEEEQASQEDDWSDDGRSTGLLVANDVDYKRAQMLIHQCKRLNSPNLVVTNHDATMFPSIKLPSASGNSYLKFDRILADVPCSGDGTTRKNPEIWKDWTPAKCLGLHVTQVRILVRALQMLKVGGRVVYSTCSMNPIENEAVIASAVDRCGGPEKVKLIPQDDALPGLKRRQGLTNWKVMDKGGEWWDSFKQMTRTREEKGLEPIERIVPGMFPPEPSAQIPLQNCMRVYAHLQDTGGFFITVLEKQAEIKARPEKQTKAEQAPPMPKTQVPVDALLDELSARKGAADEDKKLESLSEMEQDIDASHVSQTPAQRQNQGVETTVNGGVKRELDTDAADALQATKRLKTRGEEVLEPTPVDQLDRMVHYPPPPGAALESTEHHHDVGVKGDRTPDARPNPTARSNGNVTARSHAHSTPEEAFIYLDPSHEALDSIRKFYALSQRFPSDRYLVRNPSGDPVKSIYYTSALVKSILQENEGSGMKFVHGGVKMFVKQDTSHAPEACKWRIQSEGIGIIEGWVGHGRSVRLTKRETLRKLLKEMFPKVADGGWRELGEIGEQVRDVSLGCCVLRVEPTAEAAADGFDESFVMPLWRGAGSLNLMLPKEDRKAMLLRLFNDDEPLLDHSRDRFGRGEDKPAAGDPDSGPVEDGAAPAADDEEQALEAQAGLVEADAADNAVVAEQQAASEEVHEVAPGVVDEDESANKTV